MTQRIRMYVANVPSEDIAPIVGQHVMGFTMTQGKGYWMDYPAEDVTIVEVIGAAPTTSLIASVTLFADSRGEEAVFVTVENEYGIHASLASWSRVDGLRMEKVA